MRAAAPRPQPPWRRRRVLAWAPLLAAGTAPLPAGCAPPGRGAPGARSLLYVMHAAAGAITPLDRESGHALRPLPAGPVPAQVAAAPDGSLLVRSGSIDHTDTLTHVARSGGSWVARPMLLAADARATVLRSDGTGFAAVAYYTPSQVPGALGRRWHLALADIRTGTVGRTHDLALALGQEQVLALAMEGTPTGPVVYLATWGGSAKVGGRWGHASGRVLALYAMTGDVLRLVPTQGMPTQLVLAPSLDRLGTSLYCLERVGGPEREDEVDDDHETGPNAAAHPWRLVGLDTATLLPERQYAVGDWLLWLAVAPEGDHAYALTADGRRVVGDTTVVRVDLVSGTVTRFARLPGEGRGLVVTASRVYVASPTSNAVWALDRQRRRPVQTILAGRGPTGLALDQAL